MSELATQSQERSFGSEFLDRVMQWLADNATPQQVFSEDDLRKWAKDYNSPEDIFDRAHLEQWADENGWQK